jgi:hypothetical protein
MYSDRMGKLACSIAIASLAQSSSILILFKAIASCCSVGSFSIGAIAFCSSAGSFSIRAIASCYLAGSCSIGAIASCYSAGSFSIWAIACRNSSVMVQER